MEIVAIAHCLPDKKAKFRLALQLSLLRDADRAQNLPGPFLDNVLSVLQMLSKSVYVRPSYSRTRMNTSKMRCKVNAIFG